MRIILRTLILMLLTAFPSLMKGQVSNPTLIFVSTAPSGSCSAGSPAQMVVSTGIIYTCQAGTWASIGGGSGGATFPGTNGIVYNTSTTASRNATAGDITALSPLNPTTCLSNTTGNKCLGVSPYLAVASDWTAAIRQAIADLNTDGGGTLWVPSGTYNVNGSLTNTCGENAVISMPCIPYFNGNGIAITIRGFNWPNQFQQGSIITTAITTGNLFGGNNTSGNTNPVPMTYVWFAMENITINGPANTGAVMVNAQHIAGFSGKHLAVLAPSTTLTSTTGGAILMPVVGNNDQSVLDDVSIGNFYTGIGTIGEHSDIGRVIVDGGHDCFVFDLGPFLNSGVPYGVGSLTVRNMAMSNCIHGISAGVTQNSYINVLQADFDVSNTTDIYDPSNFLHGSLTGKKGNTGISPGTIVTNGATNLSVFNTWSKLLAFPGNINLPGTAGTNATINYGANFGVPAIYLYDNGPTIRYGWGLQSGEQQFFVPTALGNHFSWNAGGDLQPSGTNELMRLTSSSATVGFLGIRPGGVYGWGIGATGLANLDTGLSRDSADVVDCGNGTQADKSCTLNVAALNIGGVAVQAPISNAITSATGGTGTGTITCVTAACTNLRGSYTVAGGTFTTGNLLVLVWPTTTTAYACSATVVNDATGASIGYHSVATATGMNITSLTSALGLQVDIDYRCSP